MSLKITDLTVRIADKTILQNFNLNLAPGKIVAIMGPNGSGKTTLSKVISRHPDYEVCSGSINFNGVELLDLSPDLVAQQGVFMSFQYPVALPGVSNLQFLKAMVNSQRKARGLSPMDAFEFLNLVRQYLAKLEISEAMLQRSVNDGFSGGEKKRNEILQLLLLQPKIAILDETDSGLDIDALKLVASSVRNYHQTQPESSILIITHYQRLLDYIQPDQIHVMSAGKIVHTGDAALVSVLEERGYAWLQ